MYGSLLDVRYAAPLIASTATNATSAICDADGIAAVGMPQDWGHNGDAMCVGMQLVQICMQMGETSFGSHACWR